MNRQEVMNALEQAVEHQVCKDRTLRFDGMERDYCVPDLMYDALALLKAQEWHTLTEDDDGFINGLPGDDGQYLMTDGKDIWIDEYMDGVDDGIILDSGRDIREITAWMYMPELPKQYRR